MSLTRRSSTITRLGAGTLSVSTLLGSSTYLVDNFPTTNDMTDTGITWDCIGEDINDGVLVTSIDGSGGVHGFASGTLRFASLTPQMGLYLLNTILQGQYVNDVTIAVYHPTFDTSIYNCKLQFPTNLGTVAEKVSASIYSNVRLNWFRGSILGNSWDESFDTSWG